MSSGTPLFTWPDSKALMQFEEEIGYFFGAQNRKDIKRNYLKAIEVFELPRKDRPQETLGAQVVPYLLEAYLLISSETGLIFNPEKAAHLEFDLIVAHSQRSPFEDILTIMMALYGEVFQSSGHHIKKAALLRTFLYQYKIHLLERGPDLEDTDIQLMKSLAQQSEKALQEHQLYRKSPEPPGR